LVYLSTRLIPLFIHWKFPVKKIIQQTIFRQFVGGEQLYHCKPIIDQLQSHQVQVILDYGVEGGDDTDEGMNANAEHIIKAIEFAEGNLFIPFVSMKVTGIASMQILEVLNEVMQGEEGSLADRYVSGVGKLSATQQAEWKQVEKRIQKVASIAALYKVGLLIDAEESWIQDSIDGLVMSLLPIFNSKTAVIYHTVQLYRTDRLEFLKRAHREASEKGLKLGVKLVRGAYMEKERARAKARGVASPVHADKVSTDKDFESGVSFCIDHLNEIAVVLASHNEASNLHAVELLQKKNIDSYSGVNFHFSQLFGMSDHITFNLANAGFSVSKYLPYGSVNEVIPYLMRRAQENTSVQGQTSRELALIKKEIKRRGL
jgi:proline dehydrogenase